MGSPDGSDNEESACNAGYLGLIPGLGRSCGEGKGYLNPVFWPGEFHGLYSPWGCKESETTERLSLTHSLCTMLPPAVGRAGNRKVSKRKLQLGRKLSLAIAGTSLVVQRLRL